MKDDRLVEHLVALMEVQKADYLVVMKAAHLVDL
jgi:hypothetical protein